MKIKSTIAFLVVLTSALLFLNNSAGPANVQGLDRTGSPISAGSCNSAYCHTDGAFDPTISLEVLTGEDAIAGYEPGAAYKLRVTISAGTGTPSAYGFQAVALNSDNEIGGSLDFFPSGGQQIVSFANGIEYTEHSTPSASNTFTTGIWTAPDAGEGDITFYVAGLATNGNGNSQGDGVAIGSVTLSEGFLPSSTDDVKAALGISVFPNPTQEIVNLKINSQNAGLVNLKISDVAGKMIHSEQYDLNKGDNVRQVDISDLNNGLYLLYLSDDSQVITETIVKI